MTAISLKQAKTEDVPFFVELENEEGATEFLNPDSKEKHLAELQKKEVIYLNILVGDQIKGFFILVIEDDEETVEFRRVVIGEKGKGVGQAAIAAMEMYARTILNRKLIWLDVFKHNARGIHIYKKLGYREFKSAPHPKGILIFMRKEL